MREIKFRGTAINGETVYGDLTHERGHAFINDRRVKPDTVAQLCGFDDTGDEIYVGDEFTDANGNKLVAVLVPCLINRFTGEPVRVFDD